MLRSYSPVIGLVLFHICYQVNLLLILKILINFWVTFLVSCREAVTIVAVMRVEVPTAILEVPTAIQEVPTATQGVPAATKEDLIAILEVPVATKEIPVAVMETMVNLAV